MREGALKVPCHKDKQKEHIIEPNNPLYSIALFTAKEIFLNGKWEPYLKEETKDDRKEI